MSTALAAPKTQQVSISKASSLSRKNLDPAHLSHLESMQDAREHEAPEFLEDLGKVKRCSAKALQLR